MLSDSERSEIDHELAQFPQRKAAGLEALKIVQRHRRWVTDEGLRDIAEYLGMTTDELDSLATFYNPIFRRPVGEHVITMCDSVSCWILGFEALRAHCIKRLGVDFGETSRDGKFTLLPVQCLGICDHAPALMIDRETYVDLTPDKLDKILDKL